MRFAAALTLAVLPWGCSSHASDPAPAEESRAQSVPESVLRQWRMVAETCEDDETLRTNFAAASLWLREDMTYTLDVDGWQMDGEFSVQSLQSPSVHVQLSGSLYNFVMTDDRLENWSEGDAVYRCGRVFARVVE